MNFNIYLYMALIEETFIDFLTIGTPSAGHFYLGFDLDGLPKYKNPAGEIHELGGGGGTVSGTPSYVAYFDADGSLSGDPGFTRSTQSTNLYSSDVEYTSFFGQGKDLLSSATGSLIYTQIGAEQTTLGVGQLENGNNLGTNSVFMFYSDGDMGLVSILSIGKNGIRAGSAEGFNLSTSCFLGIGTSYSNILTIMSASNGGTQSILTGLHIGENIIPSYGIKGSGIIGSASNGSMAINGIIDAGGDNLNTPFVGYISATDENTLSIGTQSSRFSYTDLGSSQAYIDFGKTDEHPYFEIGIQGSTSSSDINLNHEGITITSVDEYNDNTNYLSIGSQSIAMGGTCSFGTQSVDFKFTKGQIIDGATGMGIFASASDGSFGLNGVLMVDSGYLNSPTMVYSGTDHIGSIVIGTNSINTTLLGLDATSLIRMNDENLYMIYSVQSATYSSIVLDGFGVKYNYYGNTFSLPISYGASGSTVVSDSSGNLSLNTAGISATYSTGDGTIVTLVNGIVTSIV